MARVLFLSDSADMDNSKISFPRDEKWIPGLEGRKSWKKYNERLDAGESLYLNLLSSFHSVLAQAMERDA